MRAFVDRRWRLIVVVFFFVVLGVSAGVLLTPRTYEGTMKFLVRKARAEMVVTSDRSSALHPADVSEAEMNSEIELLNARDVLEEVAKRTLLSIESEPITAERQEGAIRRLEGSLDVVAVKKTNIISVTYTAERPELALEVLRQVSTLYLEKHLKAHRTPGAYTFFKTQAEHYQQELRQAQAQFSDFRLQRSAVLIESQKDLLVRRRSELQSQAAEVNAAIDEVNARIARLHEAIASMEQTVVAQTRSVPNQYSAERLTTLLTEMKNRRTQLLAKFQPEDRLLKELDQEIDDTASTLEGVRADPTIEKTTTLNPLRELLVSDLAKASVELVGLTARRERLAKEDAGVWQRTTNLEASTPEHDALDRELKAAEANYQLYTTKSEEARIAEALDQEKITNVSVAQAPVVAHLPSSPNRAMLLMVGVFLAGVMSLGTALIADYVLPRGDGSYKQQSDPRRPAVQNPRVRRHHRTDDDDWLRQATRQWSSLKVESANTQDDRRMRRDAALGDRRAAHRPGALSAYSGVDRRSVTSNTPRRSAQPENSILRHDGV